MTATGSTRPTEGRMLQLVQLIVAALAAVIIAVLSHGGPSLDADCSAGLDCETTSIPGKAL